MRYLASFGITLAVALLAFADTVNFSALENMERSFEARLAKNPGKLPFEILSNASAMYIPGTGVMLSSRLNLVYVTPESPFLTLTPVEVAARREKLRTDKLEKVPVLEMNMRECLADAASSPEFDAVRPTEQFAIGVTLFYFPSKEDTAGLPRQITMSAQKGTLIQARRAKVDLATVVQEQKL